MPEYLIRSETLDGIADAIIDKTGAYGETMTPAQMVTAIGSIQTGGGGISVDGIASNSEPSGEITLSVDTVKTSAFFRKSAINKVNMPNVVTIEQSAFDACSGLTSIYAPNVKWLQVYSFRGCNLRTVVLPSISIRIDGAVFQSNSNLEVVDLGVNCPTVEGLNYYQCKKFGILIIRKSSVPTLGNVSAFTGTKFESNGTGGTIYIPKSLYDHLGDGTSLDYKAATNWSTIDAYGTITWAKIEGTQYEHYYADGTPITSE